MVRLNLLFVFLVTGILTVNSLGQSNSAYEVEVLLAENTDTKEVDSVIDFSDKTFEIRSKKKNKFLRSLDYSDILEVTYSYTKIPVFGENTPDWAAALAAIFAPQLFTGRSRTHWLHIRTEKDFVVVKLNRDNHRQIRLEFQVHDVDVLVESETSSVRDN